MYGKAHMCLVLPLIVVSEMWVAMLASECECSAILRAESESTRVALM